MELKAGQGAFYGSDTPHRLVASGQDPAIFASIHFDWQCTSGTPEHPGDKIKSCPYGSVSEPAKAYIILLETTQTIQFPHAFTMRDSETLFIRIIDEFLRQDPGYCSMLRSLLLELLTTVLRNELHPPQHRELLRKIQPAIAEIQRDIGRDWKVEDLAKICGYHPTYLSQLFRIATRQSPKHFVMLERARCAKSLLLEGHSVTTVSRRLGYSSVHYFSRSFKNLTGYSPSEYCQRYTDL